jgi:uncharacterized protein (TIGR00251 family)
MFELHEKDDTVSFAVRVQPRASRTALAGLHGDAIKIRIAAPPVDGKANDECRRFIAKLIGVATSSVEIIAGESSRDKVIRVRHTTVARVREALQV